ncbi:MAG: cyanophycinase [Isosphaeraceae bacterium]|nr:cyanophycinase [Isosphaeraceae bacterium]
MQDRATGRALRRVLWGSIVIGAVALAVLGGTLGRLTLRPPEVALAEEPMPGGALVICGGGRVPEEATRRFLQLAGGRKARIVVIPTAHADADGPDVDADYLAPFRKRGVASVRLLHTRSRAQADDLDFARPLAEATGVWIGGGEQHVLSEIYAGTEVERQLKALLDRGGVIGGNSAGAAIMTRVMIANGHRGTVTEGRGFDLLPNAIIDQHFLRRNRFDRLLHILARHPELVGFGIDEDTALVVQGGRRLSVIGNSYVVACLPGNGAFPARTEFLKSGDQADLTLLTSSEAVISSVLDLDEVLEAE